MYLFSQNTEFRNLQLTYFEPWKTTKPVHNTVSVNVYSVKQVTGLFINASDSKILFRFHFYKTMNVAAFGTDNSQT